MKLSTVTFSTARFQTIIDAVNGARVAAKWLERNANVFTNDITLPPVVHHTKEYISKWAARTTANDVRDSIMFDVHSAPDVGLFSCLVSGGLGLPPERLLERLGVPE